ncbi:MAG: glycosyltransferase family 4 protein [bacterium]
MRICYICPDPGVPVLGRKGCSTHVRETCHALEQAGHQVLLLCANKGQDPQLRTNFHIVEVPPMRSKLMGYDLRLLQYNFRLGRAAERVVKKFKPDAVYERFSLYSWVGTRLHQRRNLPHILEINAFMTVEQEAKIHFLPLARLVERYVVRHSKAVICVSEPLKQTIMKLGLGPERITKMPMGVDVHHFSPELTGKEVREKWGLGDKFVVGYIGTLTGWHGVNLLYKACEQIIKDGTDVIFFVVGGDRKKVELHKKKAQRLSMASRFVFTGSIPYYEVPDYMAAIDIALIPNTTPWSSPTKMFEYQASGRAIVAPRYPAILESMDHEKDGLLFDPEDVRTMVRNIQRLHADGELRARLGAASRRRVCRTHSWESNVSNILRLFRQMGANG